MSITAYIWQGRSATRSHFSCTRVAARQGASLPKRHSEKDALVRSKDETKQGSKLSQELQRVNLIPAKSRVQNGPADQNSKSPGQLPLMVNHLFDINQPHKYSMTP